MNVRSEKVFVIGIDAMDPRLTRKYVDMGLMPNVKKLLARGAAREDLVLLGAMPTVTPPQWTTLATGANPEVHEITAFFKQGSDLDKVELNFDSRNCKAEQLWNVTARAGYKTLVWHWPGSAWPPSIDHERLHVVDGTSPGNVNMSTAQFDEEFILEANINTKNTGFVKHDATSGRIPCAVTDLDETLEVKPGGGAKVMQARNLDAKAEFSVWIMDPLKNGQGGYFSKPVESCISALSPADDVWAAAPQDALQFSVLFSKGAVRRPALLLKNEAGQYDHIAIYKNKKAQEPLLTIQKGEYVRDYVDSGIRRGEEIECSRDLRLLEVEEDGSFLRLWVSPAIDINMNLAWHPKELYAELKEKIGHTPPTSTLGQNKQLISECMHPCWEHAADWQSGCLNYLIENHGYQVIFSHFHAPDLQKHMFIRDMAKGNPGKNLHAPEDYEQFMIDVYTQIDRYIGTFIHLLDKDWTLMVVSDHAQVCPKWGIRGLGDTGLNVVMMEELGYTVLKRDEQGNRLKEIDWEKTTAVANREMHIYLNLKGRTEHGIVDPEDQYELEERIMTDLYGYRDKESGHRIISFAWRRKDAALLGLNAPYPQGGDIIYAMAEGYEHDHDDSLSTSWGECDTSVSPVFIAAGAGIKKNHLTTRVIRQVDVAPTMAVLLGTPMPAQCEGAPVYQMIDSL